MKNDTEGVPSAGPQPADAMSHVDAIGSPRPLDRAMVDGEDDALALVERDHLGPRLHAGPLLGEDEFAAREIHAGPREQERDLEREDVFAVEVLMQAVVIAGAVPEQERGRLGLSRLMTSVEEGSVLLRVADLDPHRLIPAVGVLRQRRVQCGPQSVDDGRQRISKVLVFAASVAVARHDDPAAKDPRRVVGGRELAALLGRDQRTDHGAAVAVEIGGDDLPVEECDAARRPVRMGLDAVIILDFIMLLGL
jgi:hypothetical protein